VERISIETESGRTAFEPGAEVRGQVEWELSKPAQRMEIRLFWYTQGKGTTDVQVVKIHRIDTMTLRGREPFRFVLPAEPYSFSGTLISLIWAIEAIAEPGERTTRMEIVVAPGGKEVRFASVPAH